MATRSTMFSVSLVICLALLTGCNVLPINVRDQHGALLENPVSHKCVSVHVGKGIINVPLEFLGIPVMDGLMIEGDDLDYNSYGHMCQDEA